MGQKLRSKEEQRREREEPPLSNSDIILRIPSNLHFLQKILDTRDIIE